MSEERQRDETEPRFLIPLPGGRVARLPLQVLEEHAVEGAVVRHKAPATPKGQTTSIRAGASTITINVFAGSGEVSVEAGEEGDVVAHSLSVDPTTGTSEWHTDWEYGECEYTNESGFQERIQAWHRHPFGTEYTEIYEG